MEREKAVLSRRGTRFPIAEMPVYNGSRPGHRGCQIGLRDLGSSNDLRNVSGGGSTEDSTFQSPGNAILASVGVVHRLEVAPRCCHLEFRS